MKQEEFEVIFDHVVASSNKVLIEKAKEYASDTDRMHNFKRSAPIMGVASPEKALWAYMTKHTTSVLDMVENGGPYPEALWDEKIGDMINYLILLRALVVDTGNSIPPSKPKTTRSK